MLMGAILVSAAGTLAALLFGALIVIGALAFLFLILRGTWLRLEGGSLESAFFFVRRRILVDDIVKIVVRPAFRLTSQRFPLIDVYDRNGQFAFTIHTRPFTRQQLYALVHTLRERNARITVDKTLESLLKD
ncbi:hypothetical protein C4552_03765 [Candidatus Parcubacteria bacterium]|nr:MAG: hypothetical protein C4552_03765 [Candidatus Parcubacteria bacterium]